MLIPYLLYYCWREKLDTMVNTLCWSLRRLKAFSGHLHISLLIQVSYNNVRTDFMEFFSRLVEILQNNFLSSNLGSIIRISMFLLKRKNQNQSPHFVVLWLTSELLLSILKPPTCQSFHIGFANFFLNYERY